MMNIMNPPADWSTLKKLIWLRGTPINGGEELTVSGTPPLSLPNSLGKPLKAWSVDLLPYQEGTGDPAPDNVRPIHGTDKLTITTAGKNLLDVSTLLVRKNDVYQVLDNGYVTIKESDGEAWVNVPTMPIQAGTYTLSRSQTLGNCDIRLGYENYASSHVLYVGRDSMTITITQDTMLKFKGDYGFDVTYPITDCFQLELGSTATPYTPYIAPSQTVIDVPTLSANQWDEEWEVGSYSATGQKVPTQGGRIRSVNKISVLPNTSYYTLKCVYILCQYSENEDFISFTQLGVDSPSNTGHLFTTGATTHYITFATYANYGATYNHDISINSPSTVTTYNPYNATVYTGTIGSEGGESRWGEVDLGTLTWMFLNIEGHRRFVATLYAKPHTINLLCSCYKAVAYSEVFNNTAVGIAIHTDGTQVCIYDPVYTDATSFKVAMSGVQLVYELATPTQFAVPSVTIPTPTGTATTWATAEDGTVDSMEVTYVGKA